MCVAERLVAKDSVEGEGGREEREGTHPSAFLLPKLPTPPHLFLLKTVKVAYVHTIVSRKSAHGRSTLQGCQRGGWALFRVLAHLTAKVRPCHFYSISMPSKQIIGQTNCTTEPPAASKSSPDGAQHSERHHDNHEHGVAHGAHRISYVHLCKDAL